MTLRQRIERALVDGPGTAMDLALELRRDSRRLNAYLRDLWARGLVSRWKHYPTERGPGIRRTVWMYGLKQRGMR